MKGSVLNGKKILVVDDEPDILAVLKEEILTETPDCIIDTAGSYKEATELLISWTYDLAIFDIMGVRGFDLLKQAVQRPYPVPVVMLTAHSLSPDALKQSIELGARAYLPKDKIGDIVPFLKDVLTYEYGSVWNRVLKQLEGFFNKGWGPYWRKPDEAFWQDFEKKIKSDKLDPSSD
ncbi:MAG: response regulator [Proteobacteria bacterium]|nr:response regulator [Pseudomonadota bacterium]